MRRLGSTFPLVRIRALGLGAAALFCGAQSLAAHDGVVSLAFLLDGIEVDGDLGDWPEGLPEYGVENYLVAFPNGDEDLKITFTTGYDEAQRALLLAIRVRDDVHVPGEEPDSDSADQDRCAVFFDPVHGEEPGLPLWYEVAFEADGVARMKATSNGAPLEGVRFAASRVEGETHYEWSLPLASLEPRTLGLDLQVTDFDGAGIPVPIALWGPSQRKATITGRLGDVALLDPSAFPGLLEGSVGWQGWDGPPPQRLVVTSQEYAGLRAHVAVSAFGRYRVQLPAGEYVITTAHGVTNPFDNQGGERRVVDGAEVRATVEPDQVTKAPRLLVETLEPPRIAQEHVGLLHRLDEAGLAVVDEHVQDWMEYYGVPGVSLALLQDGEVVHHRTFGVRDRGTGAPVEATTLFEAASITKPVFAFAALRLAERGVLDLDRPLHEYLPFPNIADDARSRRITARLVLGHASGLPNWAWGGPGGHRGGESLELGFEPGERFGYSGEAYNYLGRVLSHLTGKDMETLLQEEVAAVVGMEQVYFSRSPELEAVASKGHWHREVSYTRPEPDVSPASSMHTEARDFAAFMQAILARRGLEEETWDAFLTPVRDVEDEGPLGAWKQSIGLGLFLRETPHGRMVEHGGNNGDFRCKFAVFPETGAGYAVYTNGNFGFRLVDHLERMLLGVGE